MQCKQRLETYLHNNQVLFQEQKHSQAFGAQRVAESEHVSSKKFAKVVIAIADDKMVSLILPAAYRVDLERARTALGAKEIRLAHEDEIKPVFSDCEVGSVPPFGNLYGIPVYVDNSLKGEETILFSAGTYTDTMSMKYTDFEHLVHPQAMLFATTQATA